MNHERTLLCVSKVPGCSYHVGGLCSLNGGFPEIWDTFFGVPTVKDRGFLGCIVGVACFWEITKAQTRTPKSQSLVR